MFKKVLMGAATFGVLSLAPTARANGFYVSGSVGAAFREPYDSTSASATDPYGNTVEFDNVAQPYRFANQTRFDTGVDAEVAGGYRFDLHGFGAVRTELNFEYGELGYGETTGHSSGNPYDAVTYSAFERTLDGVNDEHVNGTVNVFYDFTLFRAFTPYIGVGAGYHYGFVTSGDRQRTYTVSASVPTGGNVVSGPTGGGFTNTYLIPVEQSYTHQGTYLAEVGVSIPIFNTLSIVPAYRYTELFNGKVPVDILKVGLRYGF